MLAEQRYKETFPGMIIPNIIEDEDRGYRAICCERMLVLASISSTDTWKNDVTSAWMKLTGVGDVITFELLDSTGAVVGGYPITANEFQNTDYAYYGTIQWRDVLALQGEGCYLLQVRYEMAGMPEASFIWGKYELKTYSIENALHTARLRCKFNLVDTISGINFTGENVEDCIRFKGQIRKDQPNIEYTSLIYGTRKMETVHNEQLRTFSMETDYYTDNVLTLFEDLYLLSPNDIWISDHNPHTNSYKIFDIPVWIEESPERVQVNKLAREESLTAKFTDRIKNRRAYYG